MKTIINTSLVTDYSGEPPTVTYSNPVTTVIKEPAPSPVITRIFYNLSCDCCGCCCACFDPCEFFDLFDGCGCCFDDDF